MEDALQYTQLAVNIIIILLFIMLVVMVSLLIKSIKKITTKVEDLSGTVMTIKPKVEAAIEKVNSLTDNVGKIVTKVNDNIDVLSTVVDKVKDTADSILEFEKRVQSRIEPPVMDTVNTIAAISVGVQTFIEKLKSSKKKKSFPEDQGFDIELSDSIDDVNKELEEVNAKLTDLQK